MDIGVFDDRACELGEGPLWHPERAQLFWFDILSNRLMTRDERGPNQWQFDRHVSAAGWVSEDELLVASERDLFLLNIDTGAARSVCALEADKPATRSNDGRVDPQGGFWIGTMSKSAEPHAGAIYRYFDGKLTQLFPEITIPNAICFSPDGTSAFFTDTPTRQIMRQPLDADGWPKGAPEIHIDLRPEGLNPDGAIVDAEGCMWCAQWGSGRVARYSAEGEFLSAVALPATQPSCPAVGGPALDTLYVTTAREGLTAPQTGDGCVYQTALPLRGQREHRVIL